MHRVHLESDTCDDLKAFERRLMEIIACMQPAAKRWRAILAVVLSCLVVSSCLWLADPHLSEENLIDSLKRNTFFSASFIMMIILLLCGVHRRVVAPSIIAARCRSVLAEFNLSCDDCRFVVHKMTTVFTLCCLSVVFYTVFGSALSNLASSFKNNIASPVFYADNGYDKTIAFPLFRNREMQEFQTEILHFLGLNKPPNPSKELHSPHSVFLSQYMIDLYKSIQVEADDNEEKFFYNSLPEKYSARFDAENVSTAVTEWGLDLFDWSEADTIISFEDHQYEKQFMNYEVLLRYKFDIPEFPQNYRLIGAELRLFSNASSVSRLIIGKNVKMVIFRVDNKNELHLVAEVTLNQQLKGWTVVNVTSCLEEWISSPESNFGLAISLLDTKGRYWSVNDIGMADCFMVGYFSADNINAHRRIKRDTFKTSGVSRNLNNDMDWSSVIGMDTKWTRSACQRRTLYVSFRDLGWQDWIIAPDGYAAYYCYGECSFPLNAHMNATNHAIVQTLAHLMNPGRVPKPYCAPTKLSSISVLYFDDSSNVVLKKYNNMVVKTCGCH
ncbi:Bone morphogenetic protein 5 [Trichinella papuae]|uniref:Bone morphogenetic protein 5 n=1 Tax=Trichinella papuae TaxID=268474 RepID=A0A0V1MPH6_9BILA|nr:Bone morphogenetic protein 5 [Trichinella papuae]